MATAKTGDTVRVHYVGQLVDGTVFDQSEEDEPLEFTIGEGDLIPGFEQMIIGMETGQSRTETIPADQAYGARDEELILRVERDSIPEDIVPEVGQELEIQQDDGTAFSVIIIDVDDEVVTLDGNHPLAGQDLVFKIELLDIAS